MENYLKIAATVLGIHFDGHLISSLDTGNHGGSYNSPCKWLEVSSYEAGSWRFWWLDMLSQQSEQVTIVNRYQWISMDPKNFYTFTKRRLQQDGS